MSSRKKEHKDLPIHCNATYNSAITIWSEKWSTHGERRFCRLLCTESWFLSLMIRLMWFFFSPFDFFEQMSKYDSFIEHSFWFAFTKARYTYANERMHKVVLAVVITYVMGKPTLGYRSWFPEHYACINHIK